MSFTLEAFISSGAQFTSIDAKTSGGDFVQASGNAIVAHFLGLVSSLELLRSVTQPPTEQQLKSAQP